MGPSSNFDIALSVANSLIIFAMVMVSSVIDAKVTTQERTRLNSIIRSVDAITTLKQMEFFGLTHQDDSTAARRKYLNRQIDSATSTVQSIQQQLIDKRHLYNYPEDKLKTLKNIANDLTIVNDHIKNKQTITALDNSRYKDILTEIHENLDVLQQAMLLEERNNAGQKKKFKK